MAPQEKENLCSTKTEKKTIQDELLEKLKLDEEREKKKLAKEAKKREELEKFKKEGFERQAALLAPVKKKNPHQPKIGVLKIRDKSNNKKKQSHKSENQNGQTSHTEAYSWDSNRKSSVSNKQQSQTSGNRYRRCSSSSESYSYNTNSKSSAWGYQQPQQTGNRYRRNSSSSESSWVKNDYRHHENRSRCTSNSGWEDLDEHFPALGAEAPEPQVNVWEERKYKREENKALEPLSKYDEEAMLQQALRLSMMEAEQEEENKRKLEEEYRLQSIVLEANPEIIEFDASDEFFETDNSEQKPAYASQTVEQYPNSNIYRNTGSASNIFPKDQSYRSGGAKPKLNKIIDTFGGWGLKDTNRGKHSDTLTNFVDDVVNEKPVKKSANKNEPKFKSNASGKSVRNVKKNENAWLDNEGERTENFNSKHISSYKGKKSPNLDPWDDEISYDGKGSEISNSQFISGSKENKKSSNLDPWEDEISYNGKGSEVSNSKFISSSKENKKSSNLDPWEDEMSYDGKATDLSNSRFTSGSKENKKSSNLDPWEEEISYDGKRSEVSNSRFISDSKEDKKCYGRDPWEDKISYDGKGSENLNSQFISGSQDSKKTSDLEPWEDEILYDGKGTFTDIEDAKSNSTNSAINCDIASEKRNQVSNEANSHEVLDKWINSDDELEPITNGWNGEVNDPKSENGKIHYDDYRYIDSSDAVIKSESLAESFSNCEAYTTVKRDEPGTVFEKDYNSVGISQETYKSSSYDTPANSNFSKEIKPPHNILSHSETSYNCMAPPNSVSKTTPTADANLLNNDIIRVDDSSNNSPASSFVTRNSNISKTELTLEEKPTELSNEEGIRAFMSMNSSKESEIPILPPQPVPSQSIEEEKNRTFPTEMPDNVEAPESGPHILPPQPPSMPSHGMFNPPMFPGINPMFGLGMDPITMRQMLMLSNPFFASQLLAMEQYYRALGMPVDMFSFPAQTVPNMSFPGIIGASPDPNILLNGVNANASPLDSQPQNQCLDQSVPASGKNDFSGQEFSAQYQTDFDKNVATENAKSSLENDSKDSWFSSLLSNDSSSAIPPPKPPSQPVNDLKPPGLNTNELVDSWPSHGNVDSSLSASKFSHNMAANKTICDNSSSVATEDKTPKRLTALEANMTKVEVTGWGDFDNDFSEKQKTNSWDDDGWGTDNMPARSVKNPSVYEDKKKTVHRQPARQPQLSRFQSNRRFN